MKDEKLKEVIKTLFQLQSQINLTVESLNEINNNQQILEGIKIENYFDKNLNLKLSTSGILANYSILLFCSFLEEYNDFFNISYLKNSNCETISIVRQKNKAGIKRINKWKDLYNFRNQLIAHNYRIKKKSFFSNETAMHEYKIPNTLSEKNLLSGIIYFICLNIRDAFPEVTLELNIKEKMADILNLIGEVVDNEKELKFLFDKMK
ncbi:hypothetical protein FNB79_06205 [Formosa sediminum]|uniref:HEPN AbiU2-like domain-containing protein n=1 Tax=Formosa sediminum TaxID=2594004 RepID=A0A516GPY0_9FLAO|nr:hypothetical protein [Formosa sediminum]QDO93587.1 hypothetical protein FNB79_06205 [Formosa sediminum]